MAKRIPPSEISGFFDAAAGNDVQAVRDYLAGGMPADISIAKQGNALCWPAGRGHIPVLSVLLEAGANPNCVIRGGVDGTEYATALNLACRNHEGAAVELLLAHGADPRLVDYENRTAAHLLLERTRSIEPSNNYGITDLEQWHGLLERAITLMVDKGIDPNQVDKEGRTLVWLAVDAEVRPALLALLLRSGGSVSRPSAAGDLPVHRAVVRGRLDLLRQLLAAGADINATDANGQSALFRCQAEHVVEMRSLGADLERRDIHGRTALAHRLFKFGTKDAVCPIVVALLDAGARLNSADFYGKTPLDVIRSKGLRSTAAFLTARAARAAMSSVAAPRLGHN